MIVTARFLAFATALAGLAGPAMSQGVLESQGTQNPGVLGYFDPETRSFIPLDVVESSRQAPVHANARVRLNFDFHQGVKPNQQFDCTVTVQYIDLSSQGTRTLQSDAQIKANTKQASSIVNVPFIYNGNFTARIQVECELVVESGDQLVITNPRFE